MSTKKKKSTRSKVNYPSLHPELNPRVRREFIDMDYIDSLSNEEKKWLSEFVSEYYGASFSKDEDGNWKKDYMHKSKTLKKECMDDNNKRNNDVYGVSKANNRLINIDQVIKSDIGSDHIENALIEVLDEFHNPNNNTDNNGNGTENLEDKSKRTRDK